MSFPLTSHLVLFFQITITHFNTRNGIALYCSSILSTTDDCKCGHVSLKNAYSHERKGCLTGRALYVRCKIMCWGRDTNFCFQNHHHISDHNSVCISHLGQVSHPFKVCQLSTQVTQLQCNKLEAECKPASAMFAGLQDKAHVLKVNDELYNAVLGMVDLVKGTNAYYKLQLLEADASKRSESLFEKHSCKQFMR